MPKPWNEETQGSIEDMLHIYFQGESTNQQKEEIMDCFDLMQNADSLGSIMKFDINESTRLLIKQTTDYWCSQQIVPEEVRTQMTAFKLILALTEKYHALVMNPPYMGAGHMDEVLLSYAKANYQNTSNDLGAVFMEVAFEAIKENGKFGMINQAAWFFKPKYKAYRIDIISSDSYNLESALYLGPNTFPELKGEVVQSVTFIASKSNKQSTISII